MMPVDRFTENLDNFNSYSVVLKCQKQTLENCITLAGDKDLPINYKKLIVYLNELNVQGCVK